MTTDSCIPIVLAACCVDGKSYMALATAAYPRTATQPIATERHVLYPRARTLSLMNMTMCRTAPRIALPFLAACCNASSQMAKRLYPRALRLSEMNMTVSNWPQVGACCNALLRFDCRRTPQQCDNIRQKSTRSRPRFGSCCCGSPHRCTRAPQRRHHQQQSVQHQLRVSLAHYDRVSCYTDDVPPSAALSRGSNTQQ